MTIQEKMNIALDDWTIIGIGMIDRYHYLVVANWSDEKKPYIDDRDNKKYSHPTRLMEIDVKNNKVSWVTSLDGLSNVHCDGGIIKGNKEAFFGSFNGITYHLDYGADKFAHEELLLTDERLKQGIGRGIDDIRAIGNHFYTVDAGNEVHRRDAAKKWTLISPEAVEYAEKIEGGDTKSLDGYSEQEIYFCGYEGNLWYYNGKAWDKVPHLSKEMQLEYVVCNTDGKVYAIDSHARWVVVGRGLEFKVIAMKEDDLAIDGTTYGAVAYKGKIYLAQGDIMEFRENHWVKANIPGVYGGVEHLASKDGMLFIGTPYSLYIYNGKETFALYGEEKDDAKFLIEQFLQTSEEFVQSGHALLDEMEKGR